MSSELVIEGVNYISSKRASEITGYSQDYVGQLARAGKIIGRRVGGLWYVIADSVTKHKSEADAYIPIPPVNINAGITTSDSSLVTFEGKTYVSAPRAAKLTGYHVDYIGQLARGGKILSRQVGRRWYVDLDALKQHKKEKDALLGAVQSSAVGIEKTSVEISKIESEVSKKETLADLHYTYKPEDIVPIPPITTKDQSAIQEVPLETVVEKNIIPINVVKPLPQNKPSLAEFNKKSKRPIAGKTILFNVFSALSILGVVIIVFNLNASKLPSGVTKAASIGLISGKFVQIGRATSFFLDAHVKNTLKYSRE